MNKLEGHAALLTRATLGGSALVSVETEPCILSLRILHLGQGLTMLPRLALNLGFLCLGLPVAGITGMGHRPRHLMSFFKDKLCGSYSGLDPPSPSVCSVSVFSPFSSK